MEKHGENTIKRNQFEICADCIIRVCEIVTVYVLRVSSSSSSLPSDGKWHFHSQCMAAAYFHQDIVTIFNSIYAYYTQCIVWIEMAVVCACMGTFALAAYDWECGARDFRNSLIVKSGIHTTHNCFISSVHRLASHYNSQNVHYVSSKIRTRTLCMRAARSCLCIKWYIWCVKLRMCVCFFCFFCIQLMRANEN